MPPPSRSLLHRWLRPSRRSRPARPSPRAKPRPSPWPQQARRLSPISGRRMGRRSVARPHRPTRLRPQQLRTTARSSPSPSRNSAGNVTSNAATLTVNVAPVHHDAAGQPDRHRGPDRDVHRGCDRHGDSHLSVEEERDGDQWRDLSVLHDSGHNRFGQWRAVHRRRDQQRRQRDQQCRYPDGQCRTCGSVHHDAAGQPDRHRGPDRDLHRGCNRHGDSHLSVEEERDGISGATSASYTTPATTASDNGAQFTVTVTNSAGNVTSNAATLTRERGSVHHDAAGQPDRHRGPNRDLHRGCDRHGALSPINGRRTGRQSAARPRRPIRLRPQQLRTTAPSSPSP